MNRLQRKDRDMRIAQYLTTMVERGRTGKPIYHTLDEAAVVFGLCSTHLFRIKKEWIVSNPETGERRIKDDKLSVSDPQQTA